MPTNHGRYKKQYILNESGEWVHIYWDTHFAKTFVDQQDAVGYRSLDPKQKFIIVF